MRPGKQRMELALALSTALSRTPATQRSGVEGDPGPSARTRREAAPNLTLRGGWLRVALDPVLAHDRTPGAQLLVEEGAQLLRPAEGRGDLLRLGNLLRDALLLQRRRE